MTQRLLGRLRHGLKGDRDAASRLRLLPKLPHAARLELLRIASAVLDPFPHGSAASPVLEAVTLGAPFVTLSPALLHSRGQRRSGGDGDGGSGSDGGGGSGGSGGVAHRFAANFLRTILAPLEGSGEGHGRADSPGGSGAPRNRAGDPEARAALARDEPEAERGAPLGGDASDAAAAVALRALVAESEAEYVARCLALGRDFNLKLAVGRTLRSRLGLWAASADDAAANGFADFLAVAVSVDRALQRRGLLAGAFGQ